MRSFSSVHEGASLAGSPSEALACSPVGAISGPIRRSLQTGGRDGPSRLASAIVPSAGRSPASIYGSRARPAVHDQRGLPTRDAQRGSGTPAPRAAAVTVFRQAMRSAFQRASRRSEAREAAVTSAIVAARARSANSWVTSESKRKAVVERWPFTAPRPPGGSEASTSVA